MALATPVKEIVEKSNNPLLGKCESWSRVELGEIATVLNGYAFKSSQFSKEEGIPLIRIRDIGKETTDTNYVGEYDPKYIIKPGDLIVGMDGDFSCARWRGPEALLNQRVCRIIITSDTYESMFLNYALPGYLKAINEYTSSVTVKHLSSKTLLEIPLPLPPFDQQKRIVAELEKQLSCLDESVGSLKRAKANLKRYKASVLKVAVEGKLTEEWRKINPDVEPADKLLERILTERRRKWEETELKKIKAKGKEPKDDKWKSKYREIAGPNTFNLPELSDGWVWITVEQVAEVGTGATPLRSNKSYYYGGSIPWVTSGALNNLFVEDPSELITEQALVETNVRIFPRHTLLIAMYGEGKTRGKVSELLIEATTNQACAAIVVNGLAEEIRPYIKLFFQKNYDDIRRLSSGGVQPNLNLSHIRNTAIPLPPLDEQIIIVRKIEEWFSVMDSIEIQFKTNQLRGDYLRQTIMKEAFSGNII